VLDRQTLTKRRAYVSVKQNATIRVAHGRSWTLHALPRQSVRREVGAVDLPRAEGNASR
jgi:hypothetical protein